jgi:NAD(P)-dependent dehydrogenase (short-subunit alcohol dehydrogenase family)
VTVVPAARGLPLEGQVVVITGAGSGIGRGILDAFCSAGANVLAADISANRLAQLAGLDRVETIVTDVTVPSDLEAMIARAVDLWGRIDVLCNNAGRPDAFRGVEDCTDEEWELGLALHLTAPFLASHCALPHMLAAGHGIILNTVSTAGLTGNNGGASYTASKHGLIGLTRSTAAMYCVDGIRAVAICPGAVDTDATEIMKRRLESGEVSERFLRARDRTFNAFTRRAQPAEFGALAVYLATGGADLLNGAVLPANSGYSAH